MPRARTSTDADNEVTAPKKRAASTRTRKAPVARKRATKKAEDAIEEASETTVARARKAPTTLADAERARRRSVQIFLGVATLSVVLFVSGVVFGVSDEGQIDVAALTQERNERIMRGEVIDERTGQPVTRTIPVQNTNNQQAGNLRPSTRPGAEASTPADERVDTASTTASTTESITTDELEASAASSTDAALDTPDAADGV